MWPGAAAERAAAERAAAERAAAERLVAEQAAAADRATAERTHKTLGPVRARQKGDSKREKPDPEDTCVTPVIDSPLSGHTRIVAHTHN